MQCCRLIWNYDLNWIIIKMETKKNVFVFDVFIHEVKLEYENIEDQKCFVYMRTHKKDLKTPEAVLNTDGIAVFADERMSVALGMKRKNKT